MPAPTTALPDCAALLTALRAADILTPAQYAKATALAPAGPAASAAAALVAAGLVTRFQADRLLSGRTDGFVLGQYIILEQIGRGANGRVYKARHRTMNRLVAIKVLSADFSTAGQEALHREIQAAGKLTHPNIVTAYDVNELHGRYYLVLEFVDGPNLELLLRQQGPLRVADACAFVHQVALGLQHAHEKGMVHRDLKPANLLVARSSPSAPPAVKIADFGIPKSARAEFDFRAPEQLVPSGLPADHRVDLYALGCLFFFLLTGRPPFAGGQPEDKLRRHLWEEIPPINRFRPDVPPDVAAILYRLLAKHPAQRYSSAAEVALHLEATCIPVGLPGQWDMNFDLPAPPPSSHDGGYLTGRQPQPGSRTHGELPVETPPWAQLTDEVEQGDTLPLEFDDTPAPSPAAKPPGHRENIPIWMTIALLTSVVLLSLMGIGVVIRLLVK